MARVLTEYAHLTQIQVGREVMLDRDSIDLVALART
jgi:hypothetical protein